MPAPESGPQAHLVLYWARPHHATDKLNAKIKAKLKAKLKAKPYGPQP